MAVVGPLRRLGFYVVDDTNGEYYVSLDRAVTFIEGKDEGGHADCILGWLRDCRAIASELDPGPPLPATPDGLIFTDRT